MAVIEQVNYNIPFLKCLSLILLICSWLVHINPGVAAIVVAVIEQINYYIPGV